MTTTDTMRVIDTMTPHGAMVLDLPLEWARPAGEVQVRFAPRGTLGWHATVYDGDEQVLDLAWHDHVDRLLLAGGRDLPVAAPEDYWICPEQCWWGGLFRRGDQLYVVEVDDYALERSMGPPPRLMRPGHICVGDTEVLWHRVGAEAWEAAWREARAAIERGDHATT